MGKSLERKKGVIQLITTRETFCCCCLKMFICIWKLLALLKDFFQSYMQRATPLISPAHYFNNWMCLPQIIEVPETEGVFGVSCAPAHDYLPGSLDLGIPATWASWLLSCACFLSSLSSHHSMLASLPQLVTTKKWLQTLPNVPKGRITRIENHWPKCCLHTSGDRDLTTPISKLFQPGVAVGEFSISLSDHLSPSSFFPWGR